MKQFQPSVRRLGVVLLPFCLSAAGCEKVTSNQAEPSPLPQSLQRFCESQSGHSHYYLIMDLTQPWGLMRYQYFGQDIQYEIVAMEPEKGAFRAKAVFASSGSGETRGNEFWFRYDVGQEMLTDGITVAKCAPLQDTKLIELAD